MPDDRGMLREISWRELFPFLLLARVYRVAAQPQLLLLAAAGIVLTVAGWNAVGQVFSGADDSTLAFQVEQYSAWPWNTAVRRAEEPWPAWLAFPTGGNRPLLGPWELLSRPFRLVFSSSVHLTALVVHLLNGLWAAAVWAFFGGAICRVAAVRLASDERVGLKAALEHATRYWTAYFFGPAGTLLVVLAASLMAAAVGWLLTWDWGIVVIGVIWPLLLLVAVLGVLVLAGLLLGWPLMWATIGTERSDHFDALSRSFSYVFGRPLHYLFYLAVAALLGLLGWIFVAAFAEAVIYITAWSVSWGAGADRFWQIIVNVPHPMPTLFDYGASAQPAESGTTGDVGIALIRFWCIIVQLLVAGFVYSFFWSSACGIYALLRYHRDGTELDEVDLDDDAAHELPDLQRDEQDVPIVPETDGNGE
jgi:hypothetical protein